MTAPEPRLTDRELNDVAEHVACHMAAGQPGIYMEFAELLSLIAEVRAHRKARLSAEEREALRGTTVHCYDDQQLALATGAIDRMAADGEG